MVAIVEVGWEAEVEALACVMGGVACTEGSACTRDSGWCVGIVGECFTLGEAGLTTRARLVSGLDPGSIVLLVP